MPTYLYLCPTHGEFEEFHSISYKLETCPHCEKENVLTDVKRLICSTTKGVVELTGQDLVDKCKSDVQKLKSDAAQKEKVYANLLGEDRYQSLQQSMDKRKRR